MVWVIRGMEGWPKRSRGPMAASISPQPCPGILIFLHQLQICTNSPDLSREASKRSLGLTPFLPEDLRRELDGTPGQEGKLHFHETPAIGGIRPEGKFDRGFAGPEPGRKSVYRDRWFPAPE